MCEKGTNTILFTYTSIIYPYERKKKTKQLHLNANSS